MITPQDHIWFLGQLRLETVSFADINSLQKYLAHPSDFEEFICQIYDDLDVVWRLNELPDDYKNIKEFGLEYFENIQYLIGTGMHILPTAPIYNPKNQEELFAQTAQFQSLIESQIG